MSARPFCYVCRRDDRELRPYGKGGKPICFPCMKSNPAREREARRRMKLAFDAAGDLPVIGSEEGPVSIEEAQRRGLPFVVVDAKKGPPPEAS